MQNKSNLKYYSLDFSLCTTLGEVYAVIQRSLELPEWFGANLDALWDALIGIMHTPAQIAVQGCYICSPEPRFYHLIDSLPHILNKYPVPSRRVFHEDVRHRTYQFSVLNNRTSAHE